ncbi:MAG: T9SS type A sorting domain-containing protein [Fluviicola sp.]
MSFIANSQTHSPIFPDTNAVWIQRLFVPPDVTDIFGDGQYYNHFVYTKKQVGQDTLYNQLLELSWTYGDYELFENEFLDFDEIMVPEEKVLGKYRIEGNKVFYKHLNITPLYETYSFSETSISNNLDSTEIVLYDFGLEVNDTFRIVYSNSLLRVTSKDSILIEGTYYDRFFFEHDSSDIEYWLPYNYHWIAGIGSSMGFFPYYNNFEQRIEFNCFHDDYDIFDYFPIGNNCYFGQLSELSQSNFSIYPQPFTNAFTISSRSELTSPLSYQLVDVFGRIHLQGKLENQTQTIDAKDLPAGMYFLKIDNGDGKSVGLRLIKY